MTMPTSERQPNRRDEHLTDAELNELVDGTLAGRDLERAQAHLASCAECEERYQTLLATVTALKQAPSVMPRRTFQLTPEQAKLPEKQPSWLDRFAERILPGVPAIKAATIAVALLLVSVTAFDVLTDQSGQDDSSPQTSVQREADAPRSGRRKRPTGRHRDADAGRIERAALRQPAAQMPRYQESESDEESAPVTGAADESFTSSAMQEAPAAPGRRHRATDRSGLAHVSNRPRPHADRHLRTDGYPVAHRRRRRPGSDGWSAGFTLSWWRIAELGLLMILVWLLVSWVGRSRVGSLDD